MPPVVAAVMMAASAASTSGSGVPTHLSKGGAVFLWLAISTVTLGIAGFLVCLTIRLSHDIVRKMARPDKLPPSPATLQRILSLCVSISSLLGLVAGIVAVSINNNQGWPNKQMRLTLLYIHLVMLGTEGCSLILVVLCCAIAGKGNKEDPKVEDEQMDAFEMRPPAYGVL
ncbi:hypothetical protein LTR56_008072 [Elasticomyces elasticus]|nr:hypothetical protein LTR56_008072 [Elasticomyces elasticus]KAK3665827.1 hypothetical protein LTR22_003458 [Elasticomyces elasticus]KAK4926255.1 hypothetical protein LTR49_006727 [Elasticomyces elasticus]KAK5762009.1 hypothetical protein LTS12_007881 [Elasticomyces elasticus]